MRARILFVGCTVALIDACGGEGAVPDAVQLRDSAGVTIVESDRQTWAEGEAWYLGPAPDAQIGEADSLFDVGDVVRLRNGNIAIAHGGASEIRIYSPDGRLITQTGRAGSGPGEFREISRVIPIANGDSILVFDLPQFRASVLDTAGRFIRSYQVDPLPTGLPALVQDAFGDGSLLLSSGTPPNPTLRGLVRPSRSLWRSRQDGTPPLLLAEFAGRETFYQETPTGGVDFRRPFFGHTSTSAAGRDRVFWAVTDTFEIRVHTLEGRPLAVFRKWHDYATITAADAEPLIAQRLEAVPDPNVQRQVRRMLGTLPAEGRAPAFGWPVWADALGPELQVDDDGNLWVVEYFLPRETRNARTVFSQDGVWLGSVVLPPAFAPAHIGSDFVLGTWRDNLDVEQVQLYDLIKPGR